MKSTLLKIALVSFAAGLYVGCSPVKFGLNTSACTSIGQNCVEQSGGYHFDTVMNVAGGKVDILIVDDNSASMSSMQQLLASKFAGFIDQLDANGVDYHIGLTTTDISSNVSDTVNNYPRAINNNGALQDGNLVPFGSNPFLTNTISNRVDLFNSTIVRPETVSCEQFIANWVQQYGANTVGSANYSALYTQNCPSGDNRDIFAANLTLQKNPSSFIRDGAALAIIILGDSDERDGMYLLTSARPLANLDQPETLITSFQSTYGASKPLSVHAITVTDSTCLAERASQLLGNPPVPATLGLTHGSIGAAFLALTNAGWGTAVDICSSNYTPQLSDIATTIIHQASSIQLGCTDPTNLALTFTGAPSTTPYTVNNGVINFTNGLPAGASVEVVYDCASLSN